jgi:hypothetical protein
MKSLTKVLTGSVIYAALLLATHLQAQSFIAPVTSGSGSDPRAFSGTGVTNPATAIQSNVVWFCTSAKAQGIPRLHSIDYECDIVANRLKVYASTNFQVITNSQGTSNILNCAVTGFASNDVVLVHFYTPDIYQYAVVTNVTGGLGINITTAWGLTNTGSASSSDRIYKMQQIAQMGNGAVTNYAPVGNPYVHGREGFPLLFSAGFSNAAAINRCSGDYWIRK